MITPEERAVLDAWRARKNTQAAQPARRGVGFAELATGALLALALVVIVVLGLNLAGVIP